MSKMATTLHLTKEAKALPRVPPTLGSARQIVEGSARQIVEGSVRQFVQLQSMRRKVTTIEKSVPVFDVNFTPT
jgi:hypothetical protein